MVTLRRQHMRCEATETRLFMTDRVTHIWPGADPVQMEACHLLTMLPDIVG
jgi:hypothetical protein